MNKLEIGNFERQLQTMRAELVELESASKASTATVILDQTSVGRVSRMDAMQTQQMALELERRRKEQLLQIKAALTRIDKGDFGYCSVCEEEIAMGRLSINPTVTRCVGCSE